MVTGQAKEGFYLWDLHHGSLPTHNLTGIHSSSNREEHKVQRGLTSYSRQRSWSMAEMGPGELVALLSRKWA